MASFRIRQYQEQDYEAVRALFARGILEHAPAGFRHVLRASRVRLALLAVFVAARAAAGSWVLGLGAVALALVLLWLLVRSVCAEYVREALGTDLCDVAGTYLRSPDCRFWVAEEGGAVVGMVAVEPAGGGELELRRMSVGREHRGRGLAQALCREVLAFARARGYGAVVLSTSVVQVAAQRLYEGVGFRRVGASSPSLLGTLLNFQVLRYRHDLGDGAK
ncbi:N-acetyltransferase 8 [Parus major]|uniref:N-acetyltransferase 8 n=1 Tax=Parus major TaxID=9157 RepID=UPI00077155E5|nr:N-acetyltransferase 8 [Parus major]XP_015472195.1 N-acetyltransferase 8 [Parus major]